MSSIQLKACKDAALTSGLILANMNATSYFVKPVIGLVDSFHSIVTDADNISNREILRTILRHDNGAFFMTEESSGIHKKRIIGTDNLSLVKANGMYVIDELDGTSPYSKGHYEWSISVGFVDSKLQHTAGAVFAPKIDGGTLFYASSDSQSFVLPNSIRYDFINDRRYITSENSSPQIIANVSKTSDIKKAYIVGGPDCFLSQYPVQRDAYLSIANKVRTVNSIGSCALGLGLVAAGRIDALMQPPQFPWDWAAGRKLVEQAGGILQFYEMKENVVIPITSLRLEHYNPAAHDVGFVAGNRTMVSFVMDELLDASRKLSRS
jgi:fructose-1,6-bisphosphatase/inositol monophosphatase family enzyme